MAVAETLDFQQTFAQNPELSPIPTLCMRLLALGCDLFDKKALAKAILNIDDIDESKLQNILTCEKKRLHKFANEFFHDQHLLNLQALLVKLVSDLIEKISNPATTLHEFQCALLRMTVLIQELDIAVAKAKRKKRLDLDSATLAFRMEEESIRIAAEKSKENLKKEHQAPSFNYFDISNDPLALLAQLEKELQLIDNYAKQACQQLPQFQLYVRRRRVEVAGGMPIEQQLRRIIEGMELTPNMQHSVLAESLRQSYMSPFQTSLRRKLL